MHGQTCGQLASGAGLDPAYRGEMAKGDGERFADKGHGSTQMTRAPKGHMPTASIFEHMRTWERLGIEICGLKGQRNILSLGNRMAANHRILGCIAR